MSEIVKVLKALSRYIKNDRLSSKFVIEDGKLIFSDERFLLIYELGGVRRLVIAPLLIEVEELR